jgi:formylmethanofuran dehydrogenase subunit C
MVGYRGGRKTVDCGTPNSGEVRLRHETHPNSGEFGYGSCVQSNAGYLIQTFNRSNPSTIRKSMLKLTLTRQPSVPLETEVLSPDVLSVMTHDDICAATIYHGKRQCRMDEFFAVEGEPSEDLELYGDLSRVRWIGRAMTHGTIKVQGSVGMHLGAYMKGGSIEVSGDASDWVGAEMRGGLIRVEGDAGGQIGAGYRGSLTGMRGGTIIVAGTAGLEVGLRMRRGTIVVGGVVRDFAGLQMKGGTIVLLAGAEIRTGAWMNRGTIISLKPLQLMPTFQRSSSYNPTFISVYAKHLASLGVELLCDASRGAFARYTGDSAVPGKGEIFVWQPTN